jgi:hypothetical protein
MKLDELKAFAEPQGFRPFVIKTKGGLTMEVPHPEFVTIPPDDEASFIRGLRTCMGGSQVPGPSHKSEGICQR